MLEVGARGQREKKHLLVHTCAHKIEVRLVWFEGEGSPTVCVGRT